MAGGGSARTEAALLIVVLLWPTYAYFYQSAQHNETARLDLTRALVEDHAVSVDKYRFNSGDLVRHTRDGQMRTYSSKAPGVSLLGVVPLWWTHHALSLLPLPDFIHWHAVAYVTVVCTVGLLSVLAAVAAFAVVHHATGSLGWSVLAIVALWIGSLMFPYSTLYYGHQPAGALLSLAFFLAFELRRRSPTSLERPLLFAGTSGALAGLAVLTEYPTALLVLPLAVYTLSALPRGPQARALRMRMAGTYVAGLAVGAIVLLAYNAAAFGNPLFISYSSYLGEAPDLFPVQREGLAGVRWPGLRPFVDVLGEITVKPQRGLVYLGLDHGLYACNPVLWIALPGLALLFRSREWRAEAWCLLAMAVAYVGFNACYGDSIVYWGGGASLGPRHLVPLLPLLALPLAFGARRLPWLFVPLLLLSVFSMLAATAVDPRAPYEATNPWKQLVVPRYLRGRFALARDGVFDPLARLVTADSTAVNAAKLLGVPGRWQLMPLAAWWLACGAFLARRALPSRAARALAAAFTVGVGAAPLFGPPAAPPPEPGCGLLGQYFAGSDWSGPMRLARFDGALDFDWDVEPPLLGPFSVDWMGGLRIVDEGTYGFRLESDDGSWLVIDGAVVIDNGGVHLSRSAAGKAYLWPGVHEVTVRYFNAHGQARVRLLWTPPGQGERVLSGPVLCVAPAARTRP
jgi:PA14 domain